MSGIAAMPVEGAARLVLWSLRVSLALTVVAAAVTLALWMRLSAGPVEIPWAAAAMAEQFNRTSDRLRIQARSMVLSLGDAETPAGLAFADVMVFDQDGTTLVSVPMLAARFNLSDLIAGRLQPVEITLDGASARVVRTENGRVRVALRDDRDDQEKAPRPAVPGGTAGSARSRPAAEEAGGPPESQRTARSADAISRIIAGFVGDAEPVAELARLERVAIRDARLIYQNAALGRSWRSDGAELTLEKTPEGARVTLNLDVIGERGGERMPGARLLLEAERRRGASATEITAVFGEIQPGHLAEELPELGWLAAIDARLAGRLEASLSDAGAIAALSGSLVAADGRLLAVEEEGLPFDRFALEFGYDPATERMRVGRLSVAAPAADLDLTGFADLSRDAGGRTRAVAGQLDIAHLRFAVPEIFAEEQSFDGGQIVARLDLDSRVIEIAEARLRQGPLALSVSGRAMPGEDGWITDLRVAGQQVAAEQLVALWPLRAAKGARRWLSKGLKGGTVEEVLAEVRIGEGRPKLDLAFRFSDVELAYLSTMTPITGGAGRGHLTWERMDLSVEKGMIASAAGRPIDVSGSTVEIADIWGRPAPATVRITGRGPAAAVLALIDQPPLGLAGKMRIVPSQIAGEAVVETVLDLPLQKDLKLGDVGVRAEARLLDLRMPFELKLTGPMRIAAEEVGLTATKDEMTLSGSITANGTPVRLDWEERFAGPAKGREVRIRGSATPAVLAGINLAIPGFDGGAAPVDLTVVQTPDRPTELEVSADLTPAAIRVEPVFWDKAPGLAAKVNAKGTADERLVLDSFSLSGPGLAAEGSLRLFPAGGIERASILRLDMGDLADLAVEVRAVPATGGFDLDIAGRWFDLAFLDRARGPAEPPLTPISASYAVDQVKVSEQITLGLARGTFNRAADGRLAAALSGRVGGTAPVDITYAREPGRPGTARVTGAEAGRVLDAAGVFKGASGGRLVLDATIAPEPDTSFAGRAVIDDVVVRQEAQTFRRVLEEGELGDVAEKAGSGGLAFDRVEVPFRFRGDRIEIDTALASSPSLAIKASGVVNERTRRLNMRGVISPAYALTGMLNNIPLLGTLLGGEGEGVLAMTFSVTGSTAAPTVTVNPLSLLAPGFLRNIFEGDVLSESAPPIAALPTGARIREAEERTARPPPRSATEESAAEAEQKSRLDSLLGSDL